MKKKRRLPFDIVFENDDIIVIDKPAGLLTTHTHLHGRYARETQATAENFLNDYVRKGQAKSKKRVWLVHRLDRETSGVLMFAKSERIANRFRDNWADLTEKTYAAKVEGRMEAERGIFETFLKEDDDGYKVRVVPAGTPGAKLAKTAWEAVSFDGRDTEVKVRLLTGRKNQIRVHFAAAGHPVVGDVKYGGRKAERLFLRAVELRLLDFAAENIETIKLGHGGRMK